MLRANAFLACGRAQFNVRFIAFGLRTENIDVKLRQSRHIPGNETHSGKFHGHRCPSSVCQRSGFTTR